MGLCAVDRSGAIERLCAIGHPHQIDMVPAQVPPPVRPPTLDAAPTPEASLPPHYRNEEHMAASTAPPTPPLPIDKIKASIRDAWMAGDFGVIAQTISEGAEAFIDRLDLHSGVNVLDVACGTGNTT